jgi:transcriptional regulator GlxA family with amidase domain
LQIVAWCPQELIILAQQLLEQTELSIETEGTNTGSAAAVMRHRFVKVLQTTPTSYRRAI